MSDNEKPQFAAMMLSVSQAFAEDARLQAQICEQSVKVQQDMLKSMGDLAGILRGQGHASAAEAVDMMGLALSGVSTTLEAAQTRFSAHASGWDREAGVWQQVSEQQPIGGGT